MPVCPWRLWPQRLSEQHRCNDCAAQMFDELLLLKSGGRVIYSGPLGHESSSLVRCVTAVPAAEHYMMLNS